MWTYSLVPLRVLGTKETTNRFCLFRNFTIFLISFLSTIVLGIHLASKLLYTQ